LSLASLCPLFQRQPLAARAEEENLEEEQLEKIGSCVDARAF